MKLEDLLSPREIAEYHDAWKQFPDKHLLAPVAQVYHGRPLISRGYQHGDRPLFRYRVVQREVKKWDPTHFAEGWYLPYWDAVHFLTIATQAYHSSVDRLRPHGKEMSLEVPERFAWRRIYVREPISVEVIIESREERETGFRERINLTFYTDRANAVRSEMSGIARVFPRAYVDTLERTRKGEEAPDRFRRQIERQAVTLGRLLRPRTDCPSKADMLGRLQDYARLSQNPAGQLSADEDAVLTRFEADVHSYFSLWDLEREDEL